MKLVAIQFMAGLVGGALAALIIERMESGVKWFLVLFVIVGVLAAGGAVKASEVQQVDSSCHSATEICDIGEAFFLAIWKGTIPMFVGLALSGLFVESQLKKHPRNPG